jgi:hypothetical protein
LRPRENVVICHFLLHTCYKYIIKKYYERQSHRSTFCRWLRTESNRRHMDFQSIALPTELLSRILLCNEDHPVRADWSALGNDDSSCKNKMAVRTGLEPATSCVTGRHSNQLNYRTRVFRFSEITFINCFSKRFFITLR